VDNSNIWITIDSVTLITWRKSNWGVSAVSISTVINCALVIIIAVNWCMNATYSTVASVNGARVVIIAANWSKYTTSSRIATISCAEIVIIASNIELITFSFHVGIADIIGTIVSSWTSCCIARNTTRNSCVNTTSGLRARISGARISVIAVNILELASCK